MPFLRLRKDTLLHFTMCAQDFRSDASYEYEPIVDIADLDSRLSFGSQSPSKSRRNFQREVSEMNLSNWSSPELLMPLRISCHGYGGIWTVCLILFSFIWQNSPCQLYGALFFVWHNNTLTFWNKFSLLTWAVWGCLVWLLSEWYRYGLGFGSSAKVLGPKYQHVFRSELLEAQ